MRCVVGIGSPAIRDAGGCRGCGPTSRSASPALALGQRGDEADRRHAREDAVAIASSTGTTSAFSERLEQVRGARSGSRPPGGRVGAVAGRARRPPPCPVRRVARPPARHHPERRRAAAGRARSRAGPLAVEPVERTAHEHRVDRLGGERDRLRRAGPAPPQRARAPRARRASRMWLDRDHLREPPTSGRVSRPLPAARSSTVASGPNAIRETSRSIASAGSAAARARSYRRPMSRPAPQSSSKAERRVAVRHEPERIGVHAHRPAHHAHDEVEQPAGIATREQDREERDREDHEGRGDHQEQRGRSSAGSRTATSRRSASARGPRGTRPRASAGTAPRLARERRVLVAQQQQRVGVGVERPALDLQREVEQAPRPLLREQDREEGDEDAARCSRCLQQVDDDELRDREQPLHEDLPARQVLRVLDVET